MRTFHSTQIEIQLTPHVFNGHPQIEIMHNGPPHAWNTLYKGDAKANFVFDVQSEHHLDFPANRLAIRHFGKNYRTDTTEDNDKGVMVDRILLNRMDFPHMVMLHGVFITDQHEDIKTNWLGHNGTFIFSYRSPVETWIINKKNVSVAA